MIINGIASNLSGQVPAEYLKTKISQEHINELIEIYLADNASLISRSTMGDAAFGQFLLLKFAECESIGTQAVQIVKPAKGGAGSVMQIIVGYGFLDEEGWYQEDAYAPIQ